MDILEFAMKMELDGKAYYERQAASTHSEKLKEILETLAEEELKHFNFFKKLRAGEIDAAAETLGGNSETLKKVKNIFTELSTSDKQESFGKEEIDAWKKALEIEERAEQFYREKASEEKDTSKKRLLNLIADEEQSHVHMIDGILTYLRFPESFADSAQFKNFQSLEGH